MEITWLGVDKLVPLERNVRLHSTLDIENLAASLTEYGWQQPLVVGPDLTVYVGNGRLAAAKTLGMATAPCKVETELSEEKLKAFAIMDNRSGELSTWDSENLAAVVEELGFEAGDLGLIGFTAGDLEFFVGPIGEIEPPPPAEGGGERPAGAASGPPNLNIGMSVPYVLHGEVKAAVLALIEERGWEGIRVK